MAESGAMTGEAFQRDGLGRPIVTDPVTGEPTKYQRTSTFAQVLDDKAGLMAWYGWQAVKGAQVDTRTAQLAARAPKTPRALLEDLVEAGGGNASRNIGSARHQVVAQVLSGAAVPDMPQESRQQLEAVLKAVRSLGTVTDVEVPLVCDEWQVAGSADYLLVDDSGRPIVADLKTGKSLGYLSVGIQLAAYARSVRWVDGQRGALVAASLPRLVAIHAPQDDPLNVQLVEFDPQTVTAWGRLAVQVRETRKSARKAVVK